MIGRFFLALSLVLAVFAGAASAQSLLERLVTPGPLSSAHAKLESNCESCHTSFRKEALNSNCTACHKGVGADIVQRRKFHGKYAPARTKSCRSCHSEHKGRDYAVVQLDRRSFNHALTDYPLTGAHAKASCTACHGTGTNYRGLSASCASCHKADEPHKGRLGSACQDCHQTSAWKDIKPFDHGKTGFALVGGHARTACQGCHKAEQWQGLSRTCITCHTADDVHKGKRGSDCASCHTSTNWQTTTFDHSSTGYPLIGGHARARCAGCHGVNDTIKKPDRTCITCHRDDDTHEGKNGTDCATCHTPRDWKQISFDHDTTDFPLRNAHAKSTCAACHKEPALSASPPVTCVGCHAKDDEHKGGNGQDCGRCHRTTTWDMVDFDHATMTDFPLTGKHAGAKCETCHVQPADVVKLSTSCDSCHAKEDPHLGRLGDCARCHDTDSWTAKVHFDHDLTRFPLLGAHSGLACAECHADKSYKAKGVACSSCHMDDHHRGTLGTPASCSSCHDQRDWKDWRFDHSERTDFPLTGQHKGLICSSCHARAGDPGDLSRECISCHRRDDVHRGAFGSDCQRCHVTSSFTEIRVPAQ